MTVTVIEKDFADDPLAPPTAQFALSGSTLDPRGADSPSTVGVRPWGLRRAQPAGAGHVVPAWRYDEHAQMAVEIASGLPLTVAGPTANTTSSTDGEDGPSSEDWNND